MAKEVKFLQGNEAVVEGALYAGCTFYAGYPITPSTEVAEILAARLPKVGGRFVQMEDELAAMAATLGGSISGRKSMTATSGPGMSLKMENLGYGYLTEIPCVIVNVMRGGPSTGLPTGPGQSDIMQAKWGTHGDHPAVALTPSTVQEQLEETVRAFNIAEKYRIPVILLTDEIIGHMREAVNMPEPGDLKVDDRKRPTCDPKDYLPYQPEEDGVAPMADFGSGYRYHITGLNHLADGFPSNDGKLAQADEIRQAAKIDDHYDDIVVVDEMECDDAEILIFAFGSTARSAKEAIKAARAEGIKVGLFRPLTIWPFPDKHLEKYKNKVKRIIVPEMNLGMAILEVKRVMEGTVPSIEGINQIDSEPITPITILNKIKEGK
ncbi:pyruvate flavodoxin/ferredoxin oxidoreductase domain protein [Denitrovibrio acetiphilus DSM 12809]|uniref:Pyruvate flavodoxin/ferredoxin oxidoreductase domain protein n=1 Tax=Denitrovibrio acetiphilus (strain DSM 12809 / NBRC 114555 / N2460) TaxID=522772 RepID=D4H3K2_DENA2|nr:2-oxoacid:acceptor oxidoreductase subunit alpha [Denitrovibrio acetiphilus]ADD69104.1 pyruvate flavodoxin/ferredoxin oxidoreductase domain protein [Denitrovibrio acetiphilus DSM 12809]